MKKVLSSFVDMMHRVDPDIGFEVRLWNNETLRAGDGPPVFTLVFNTEHALVRVIGDGFLGFGESYMNKEIEVEGDMYQLFRLGHQIDFDHNNLGLVEKGRFLLHYLKSRNTLSGSKRNVAHHYDLGNDYYALFLDRDAMAYTCAYFHTPADTLEQAQANKHEHVCRKVLLKPGETLIDLGCGWGGMLIHAAQHYGITGIGVTLSKPQADYANEKISALSLSDKIKVLHCDYRDAEGKYDKLVSVGMMEHVGKKFIPGLMKKAAELLKPGGIGLFHTIGNDTPFPDDPWTMKHIFPGTHVPALEQIVHELAANKLSITDVENLRPHYDLTIKHWWERFDAHFDEIVARFDESFARAWRLYLAISATSFKYGGNRLFQVVFTNGLNNDMPLTRAHLYRDYPQDDPP